MVDLEHGGVDRVQLIEFVVEVLYQPLEVVLQLGTRVSAPCSMKGDAYLTGSVSPCERSSYDARIEARPGNPKAVV